MTPSARSIHELRALGFRADKTEQRLPIPGKFVTRDTFGFGDILACHHAGGILLLQVTDRSSVNKHILKASAELLEDEDGERAPNPIRVNVIEWIEAGGRFEIWGWSQSGPRGETKRWRYRRVVFARDHGDLIWTDEPEIL
jgi:hypothetical protein